jgi:glycosyltransferase involved in cell wall biosynthesis
VGNDADGRAPRETPILSLFFQKKGTDVVNLGQTRDTEKVPGYWVDRLRAVEEQVLPAWTILINGDELRCSLRGLGADGTVTSRRRAAIFIYANHMYSPLLDGGGSVSRLLRLARWFRRRRRERSYFRSVVWRDLGIRRILTINGYFQRKARDQRIHFLPDIYRSWGFELPSDDRMILQARELYRRFLSEHQGQDVILYYGTRFARRGYDTLLALACENRDTVFVSCGRDQPGESFASDIAQLRAKLRSQQRFHEVDLPFMPDHALTDDLFSSAKYVLLPYRNFLGVSGILAQACAYGKPVLVPDIGHMASMVRQRDIGLMFRHLDESDFREKAQLMRREHARYAPRALAAGKEYSLDALHRALDQAFSD